MCIRNTSGERVCWHIQYAQETFTMCVLDDFMQLRNQSSAQFAVVHTARPLIFIGHTVGILLYLDST